MELTTAWRGRGDTTRERLTKLVLLSLLLHSPLTPIAALFGVFSLMHKPPPAPQETSAVTAIPIDVLQSDQPEPGGKQPEPKAEPKAAEKNAVEAVDVGEQKKALQEAHRTPADGGSEEAADAGAKMAAASDAGSDAGGIGAGRSIADPVALSGAAGRIADANANIRLIVYTERIRSHPLGARVGQLLAQAYQWRDFFGPSGLDPVRDIDRILIAGPQLRDSSNVVAVLKYNVAEDKIKRAIDALVKRDPQGGGWMDAGVPAATARADRADRIFVLPAPGIVVVTPPSAAQHALTLKRDTRFPPPNGSEALTTYIITPWRAFVGVPFDFPKTIKSVRMQVTPTPDGGATATLIAEDESEEAAKNDAEKLQRAIDAVINVNLGIFGALVGKKEHRIIEKVTLAASGKEIHGTAVATPQQLVDLIETVSQFAKDMAEQNARKRAAAQPEAAGVPTSAEGKPQKAAPNPPPARAADAG